MLYDVEHATRSAAFRIAATVHEPLYASGDHCARAHDARLFSNVYRRFGKPPSIQLMCRSLQKQHFGVRRSVGPALFLVLRIEYEVAAYKHCADGDVAYLFRFGSEVHRTANVLLVQVAIQRK